MVKVTKSSSSKSASRSAKLYPDGKEDLQKSINFFFGEHIDDLKEGSQQFKSAMLKLGAFGAFASAFLYYLLIFHT